MADHITRYDLMPIPPVEEQTEYFEAGAVSFGVEYRLLNDAIAAASDVEVASGGEAGAGGRDDCGVSLHVFAVGEGAAPGDERLEYLRFDCFVEDPHYHYVSWKDRSNEMLHIDPVADGDPLAWALERIATRLPQMLERAGAAEAAWRARYHHDDEAVLRGALGGERGA